MITWRALVLLPSPCAAAAPGRVGAVVRYGRSLPLCKSGFKLTRCAARRARMRAHGATIRAQDDMAPTLIRANAECSSSDHRLGRYPSLSACAATCRDRTDGECRYFRYGKGRSSGFCYYEQASNASCPEGFIERNDYDFYDSVALDGEQNRIQRGAPVRHHLSSAPVEFPFPRPAPPKPTDVPVDGSYRLSGKRKIYYLNIIIRGIWMSYRRWYVPG